MSWSTVISGTDSWSTVIGDTVKYLTDSEGNFFLTDDDKKIEIGNGDPTTTWSPTNTSSGGWVNV